MRTRPLPGGRAAVAALTELGVGGSVFGNLARPSSDEDCEGALDRAWAAGLRYIDTAPHYGLGLSERRIGSWLARTAG